MGDAIEDLLKVVETKREQLNKLALCKKLTSEEVVTSSRELDRLLNEVYSLSNRRKVEKE